MRILYKKYKNLLAMIILYWLICFLMYLITIDMRYVTLSWNIMLAVLPLLFIGKVFVTVSEKKKKSLFWVFLWLFFFPNSVYMVTDFIHLSNEDYVWIVESGQHFIETSVVYSNDIFVWIKLLVISFGFLLSLLIGLESLYLFEYIIKKKQPITRSWFWMIAVILLTSIGVYIGRFLRFNSWDVVFFPLELLKETLNIGLFGIQFMMVFTIFILSSYLLYKIFRHNK